MSEQSESINHRNIVGIHERVKAQDAEIRNLREEVQSAKNIVAMMQQQLVNVQQDLAVLRQTALGNGATG